MAVYVTIYYDYTCPYSYRALLWLRRLREAGRDIELEWKTFSLKEVNRRESGPSLLDQRRVESVSVLALELAKAAQAEGEDVFDQYHRAVFDAMQGEGKRLGEDDLLRIARDAGLDVAAFELGRQRGRWLGDVAGDHFEGVERWHVFGTPTLVFNSEAAAYLKFTEVPTSPSDAAEVFDALLCLARCHPELVEIKYPQAG